MREPKWKQLIVKTVQPILSPEQCDELIRIGQNEPKNESIILSEGKSYVDKRYRKSSISWLPFANAIPIYKVIEEWMKRINLNYFGYDNVQVLEKGQFAEYRRGEFYNWHMDSEVNMNFMPLVRKISMGILLNDPNEFKGGEFEFYPGSTAKDFKALSKRGHGVFFASFLIHRVKPITKGNRKTLTMWFGGPPLK
tara:strand:+ start:63 stop:647 length:585 start_codon:yes stop_codon:yes gene_type:complete